MTSSLHCLCWLLGCNQSLGGRVSLLLLLPWEGCCSLSTHWVLSTQSSSHQPPPGPRAGVSTGQCQLQGFSHSRCGQDGLVCTQEEQLKKYWKNSVLCLNST